MSPTHMPLPYALPLYTFALMLYPFLEVWIRVAYKLLSFGTKSICAGKNKSGENRSA